MAHLVPQNKTHRKHTGSSCVLKTLLLDNVQKWTGGITFPSFHGRGILQYDIGMLPYRRQVYVVLGEPINFGKIENPNYDEIGAAHALYIERLVQLFEKYKHLYLSSDTVLIIE